MTGLRTFMLFALTAVAEIIGCWLPWLWLKDRAAVWVLLPAAVSLILFVWLLTLHPFPTGRTYAAYGGVYVAVAIGWLWVMDGVTPDRFDVIGVVLSLAGMAVIALTPRSV